MQKTQLIMEEKAKELRDMPRELLIKIIVESQVAISTGDGVHFRMESLVDLDGTRKKHSLTFCGYCGSASCNRRCMFCRKSGCIGPLSIGQFDQNTFVSSDLYHKECLSKSTYLRCVVCTEFTREKCKHDNAMCSGHALYTICQCKV